MLQNQLDALTQLQAELLYYQQQWQHVPSVSNSTNSICHLIEEVSIKTP